MATLTQTAETKNKQQALHGAHKLFGAAILLAAIAWIMNGSGDHTIFIDPNMMLLMLSVLAGGLWMAFGPRVAASALCDAVLGGRKSNPAKLLIRIAVLSRARQLSWGAGIFGFLSSVIILRSNLDDPAALGPAISYSLLSLLYAAVLAEFIFAPLQQIQHSRSQTQ